MSQHVTKAKNASNKSSNSRDLLGQSSSNGNGNTAKVKQMAIPSEFVAPANAVSTYGFSRCTTILITNLLATQTLQSRLASYLQKPTEYVTCLQFCLLMEEAMAVSSATNYKASVGTSVGTNTFKITSPSAIATHRPLSATHRHPPTTLAGAGEDGGDQPERGD